MAASTSGPLMVLFLVSLLFTFGTTSETDTSSSTDSISPFRVKVSDELLDDLQTRLALWRAPRYVGLDEEDEWHRGMSKTKLEELVEYWKSGYSWRNAESAINAILPQFTTVIDSQKIHFAHIVSRNATAVPLLMIHGWPGSILEFLKVIPKLSHKYHIVLPSLPGYGFSTHNGRAGCDPAKTARYFATLMGRLGYDKYVVQGGDWGSIVGTLLCDYEPTKCKVLHINFVSLNTPYLNKGIMGKVKSLLGFFLPSFVYESYENPTGKMVELADHLGYFAIQATKPHTVAVGLSDSPVALLAWITEKLHGWSDVSNGGLELVYTKDEIITLSMWYWISNSIGTSIQYYYETMHTGLVLELLDVYVEVPTAVADFKDEIFNAPRSHTEYYYNLRRWNRYEQGGHFAAMEHPDVLVEDIISFVDAVWFEERHSSKELEEHDCAGHGHHHH